MDRPSETSAYTEPGQGRIQDLKWGVNFSNNVREIKYYFNIRGIWKKERKKGAQKKGGENSPISPPLDPRLQVLLWTYWSNTKTLRWSNLSLINWRSSATSWACHTKAYLAVVSKGSSHAQRWKVAWTFCSWCCRRKAESLNKWMKTRLPRCTEEHESKERCHWRERTIDFGVRAQRTV